MNPNIPFRDKETALKVSQSIKKEADTHKTYKIMEVCGTHTMAIARSGLKSMLPENVELISGPGCPVCVTSQGEYTTFTSAPRALLSIRVSPLLPGIRSKSPKLATDTPQSSSSKNKSISP